jgi:hypothetical protein
MKIKLFLIIVFILGMFCILCGNKNNRGRLEPNESSGNSYEPPLKDDNFIFLFSFGSELSNTKSEFLLTRYITNKNGMTFNKNGDIIIADEDRIKVFDESGKGKIVFGRKGQGPGEFADGSTMRIACGPSGLLAVVSGMSASGMLDIFSPKYGFVNKIRIIKDKQLNDYVDSYVPAKKAGILIMKLVPFEKDEWVAELNFQDENDKYISLIYVNKSKIYEITRFKSPKEFTASNGIRISSSALGYYAWGYIPEKKIIYVNSDEDIHSESEDSYYKINIFDCNTFEKKQITKTFSKRPYNEEFLNKRAKEVKKSDGEKMYKAYLEMNKLYMKKKYYPSLSYFITDGRYAYVRPFISSSDFKMNLYGFDIFDLETGKFVNSINLPFSSYFHIHNQMLYDITNTDKNGYPEIRVYKINPSLFQK